MSGNQRTLTPTLPATQHANRSNQQRLVPQQCIKPSTLLSPFLSAASKIAPSREEPALLARRKESTLLSRVKKDLRCTLLVFMELPGRVWSGSSENRMSHVTAAAAIRKERVDKVAEAKRTITSQLTTHHY